MTNRVFFTLTLCLLSSPLALCLLSTQLCAADPTVEVSGIQIIRAEVGDGFNQNYTYTESYRLKQNPTGKVVVEFEMWTDLEDVEVPFSITTGIGK